MSATKIAKLYGCSRCVIERKLLNLNVPMRVGGIIKRSEEEVANIIKLYTIDKLSLKSIGDIYNCGRTSITNVLKRNNIKIRNDKEKGNHPTCNEDFFETIDTEEKAYWLGFLFGDGWISTNIKHSSDLVGLALRVEDEGHIVKFQKAINSNHKLHQYTSEKGFKPGSICSRLYIKSDKMVSDLIAHGLIPN